MDAIDKVIEDIEQLDPERVLTLYQAEEIFLEKNYSVLFQAILIV